eukprot:gb/GECG01003263.1/.p1 GENE.gb/GECG01003263.1/~~gb/GECG01003263.1/.p1  ORF type:complete len:661 (+),score=69.73 gb/GECG01003263.1/:1-1983(+)
MVDFPSLDDLKPSGELSTLALRFVLLTVASTFLYWWAYYGYSFWIYVLLVGWICYLDYVAKRVKPMERQLLRRPLEEKDFRKLPAHLHPVWLRHSNVERVVWLNNLINQMWPFFRKDLEPQFKQQLTELLTSGKPHQFQHMSVSKLSFGDFPFVIEGVEHSIPRSDAFWMDIHFRFGGDIDVELCVRMLHTPSFHINLDDLLIQGTLRAAFEPLVAHSPWFQNIYLSMVDSPRIDFGLSAFSRRLDIMSLPLLKSLLTTAVRNALFGEMILPDRLCIPIIPPEELLSPRNEAEKLAEEMKGVIHFTLKCVNIDEEHARSRLRQEGKDETDAACEDLFLSLAYEDDVHKSPVFSPNSTDTLEPSFSQNLKFLVSSGQSLSSFLQINIHRKCRRFFGSPEERLLGSCVVPLSRVFSRGPHNNIEHYSVSPTTFPELKIKFSIEFLPFSSDTDLAPNHLPLSTNGNTEEPPASPAPENGVQRELFSPPSQLRRRHLERRRSRDDPALLVSPGQTAVSYEEFAATGLEVTKKEVKTKTQGYLFVTIAEARELVNADTIGTSDPYVRVKVADQTRYTSVRGNTLHPKWNETFEFFISDLSTQKLFVTVYDEDLTKSHDLMGETEFSIKDLAKFERYAFTGEFKLKNVESGFIKLSLAFKPYVGTS